MKLQPYPKYKASGVEWLGDLPEHWAIGKFSREVRIAEGQADPEVEPFVSMILVAPNHIESGTGRLLAKETAAEQCAISGKYVCRAGEVVYSKIRPALAKVVLAPEDCLCSADMYPMTPIGLLSSRYLLRLLVSSQFTAWSVLEADRVAMPKLNRETLNDLRLPVPPRVEQVAIADFLDRETAKIDTLVAKNRTLIERLKEKRTALISRTVTRGLPPDAARAAGFDPEPKLKASGMQFFGNVPNGWRVTRVWLERVGRNLEYQDGNHGEIHPKASDYVSDGVPFVMANDIVDGQIDFSRCNCLEPELSASLRIGFAVAGDVLLTHKGTIGRVGMVQSSQHSYVVLTPQVTYYRCLRRIIARFLFWFFQARAWQEQLDLVASLGTTRAYIGLLDQRFLAVLFPAEPEQHAIANFLDRETAKLDALVSKIETAIDRLQEYRTALITAAVTGKIDVRDQTQHNGPQLARIP